MWAKQYQKCTECKTTERKHRAHGLCERCYMRNKWAERWQKIKNNPEQHLKYNKRKAKWGQEHKEYYRELKRKMYKNDSELRFKKKEVCNSSKKVEALLSLIIKNP